ncbi:NAD-dependent epimerase/dehydratase family protein [Jiangella ureilytica]|uniref:NAD-dependent epimerase/dehydratase family protein n=1 Tax=Jiangella ureilytica TaxID=2530374 RepID=UPI00193DDA89|nr:NAD-dependent epimerase/dehydratase family protein [Jiangella ureilytica]
MRLVITGASGSVGTALLRRLRERPGPDDVLGVARRAVPAVPPYDLARWLQCDVGRPGAGTELAGAFAGADTLVHLAWAIQPSTKDPPRRRTNVFGTENVLHAAERAGIRHVICASSVAAYRPAPRWCVVGEAWPSDGIPGSGYSRDKADLEYLLDRFEERHPGVTVARIRPCAVVQRDAATQIAGWTLNAHVPRGLVGSRWLPFPVWPGLRAQVVHADDVAAALRLIIDQRAGGAFNLAAEPVLSSRRLGAILGGFAVPLPRTLLAALAWAGWRTGLQPSHPGWLTMSDRVALVSSRKARGTLGWRPRYHAADALAELVAGIRAEAAGASPPLAGRDAGRGGWGRPSHQSQAARRLVPRGGTETAGAAVRARSARGTARSGSGG